MNKMAKEIGISRWSVRRIIEKKLKMFSYKLGRGHLLTDAMVAKRLEKSQRMLRLVGGDRLQTILFTDEKIFSIKPYYNHQNDRELLKKGQRKSSDAKIVTK